MLNFLFISTATTTSFLKVQIWGGKINFPCVQKVATRSYNATLLRKKTHKNNNNRTC